jgi:hypothetical protein
MENSVQSCSHRLFFLLLDHLIRARQHIRRNRQADLLSGLQNSEISAILDPKVMIGYSYKFFFPSTHRPMTIVR